MKFAGLGAVLARVLRRRPRDCFRFILFLLLCLAQACFLLSPALGATLPQVLPQPLVSFASIQIDIEYGNVTLNLQRVDFWDGYIVLVGTARELYGSACLERGDFALQIGDIQYETASREKTRPAYGIDAPGTGVFIHCLAGRKPEILLLPFVAPVNQTTAVLTYMNQSVELPSSLGILQQNSLPPPPTPTHTPTPTLTPTPIPTETFTPVPAVTRAASSATFALPLSAKASAVFRFGVVSHQGVQFTLERIDLWDTLPDNTRPRNDLFLVLTGTLLPIGDRGSHCVGAGEVNLLIGQQRYPMDNMRSANQFYQSAYPGYILPQCVSGNTPVTTFFVFDIAVANEQVFLSFYAALLQLDLSMRDLAPAAPIAEADADTSPTVQSNALVPTAVLVPTSSARTPMEAPAATIRTRGVVNRNANLRAGPDTTFAIVGGVTANQIVEIIGSNSAQNWFQLVDGRWIAAFLVSDLSAPLAGLSPTPIPATSATAPPLPTEFSTP